MYCLFCIVLCIFMCKCVLYCCHRVTTQLQLKNISYHKYIMSGFGRLVVEVSRSHAAGRIPLDEWSAHRRGRYLHDKHKTRTSLPWVGFEPAIPEIKRLHTHASHPTATRLNLHTHISSLNWRNFIILSTFKCFSHRKTLCIFLSFLRLSVWPTGDSHTYISLL